MNTPKRLAFFVGSMEGGGAERVMLNLVNHYVQQGYNVDLVLANKIGSYLPGVSKGVRIVDLQTTRFWTYFRPLVKYLRESKPDAMLVATTILNIISIFSKFISGSKTHLVISEHIDIVSYANSGGLQRVKWVRLAMRLFYPWANNIVAVSNGAAKGLAGFVGIAEEKITTVYNGVIDDVKLELAKKPVKHAWFKNKKIPVILAVGRLEPQKDYTNLLHAFAILSKQIKARLLILGEGLLRKELEEQAKKLGIDKDVSLHGVADNPFQYLANTDVFVLSSKFEGLPTVLIEALACGCPVVSTDCPSGPNEILQQGRYGALVPVENAQALSDAIIKTLQNENSIFKKERQKRGLSFSVEAAVERYSQVLGLAQ